MYVNIEIKNNSFSIQHLTEKPKEHNLAKDTLAKFKTILERNLRAEEGSELALLSKKERYSEIHKLANQIAERHETKRASKEWFICRWIRKLLPFLFTENKVTVLQQQILVCKPLTRKFLPLLNNDMKHEVLSKLPVDVLKAVSFVCKEAGLVAGKVFIARAKNFGYQGEDSVEEAKRYLNLLRKTIEQACIPASLRANDWENTAENLKRCSSTDVVAITHNTTDDVLKQRITEFLLHFTNAGTISIMPTHPDWVATRDRALFDASFDGNTSYAKLLLLHGADINALTRLPNLAVTVTPLIAGASYGKKAIVEMLLEHGADFNKPAGNGSFPFHFAARFGDCEIVQLLLDKNVPIDGLGWDNRTALLFAATQGNASTVRLLLDKGADPEIASSNGSAALQFAAQEGKLDVVDMLLDDERVNMNRQGWNGRTALHFAAFAGKAEVVQRLLERGADPTIPSNNGSYPLHWAAQQGHVEVVRALIPYMPDVDVPGNGGLTALQFAGGARQAAVVQLLFEAGASTPNQ